MSLCCSLCGERTGNELGDSFTIEKDEFAEVYMVCKVCMTKLEQEKVRIAAIQGKRPSCSFEHCPLTCNHLQHEGSGKLTRCVRCKVWLG